MDAKTALALAACLMLAACAVTSDLQSDKGKPVAGHPIYTTRDAFLVDRDPTFFHPRVTAALDFIDPDLAQTWWRRDCLPASIADYQAHLHHWEEHARLACDGEKLVPLPAGTALQIDALERSWDFENGTRYYISAHLVDTALSQHDIQLEAGYFLKPSADTPWGLNPNCFTADVRVIGSSP